MNLLVVGSGPSVQYLSLFNLDNFKVICLNNAWQLIPMDKITAWCKSNDLETVSKDQPMPDFDAIYDKVNGWMFFEAFFRKHKMELYDEPEGTVNRKTTIFCDVLHELTSAPKGLMKSIWFIGCEHDYSGEKTHFYGQGKPDPVRFGEEWLLRMFGRFRLFADTYSINLINATGNTTGLLHRGMFTKQNEPISDSNPFVR